MDMAQQHGFCQLKNGEMSFNRFGMTDIQKIHFLGQSTHPCAHTCTQISFHTHIHNSFRVTFKEACFSKSWSFSFSSANISFCLDETSSLIALISAFLWITSLQSSSQSSFNFFIFFSISFKNKGKDQINFIFLPVFCGFLILENH